MKSIHKPFFALTGVLAVSGVAANGASTVDATSRLMQYSGNYQAQVSQFGGRILATSGPTNAIVGAAVQDGTNGKSFPTGVTGYGLLTNAGNQAFGIFGRCDLGVDGGGAKPGTCTSEFNVFNYSGAASTQLPPDLAFGTKQNNAIPLQIAAYGNYPSSIGVNIGYGSQPMLVGLYMAPQAIRSYGVFVDATNSDGAKVGAVLKTTTSGTPLQLQTLGVIANQNAVMTVVDNGGKTRAGIKQIGDYFGRAWQSTGQSGPSVRKCTGVGAGGTCTLETGSSDGAGTIIVTGGSRATDSGGTIQMSFSSTVGSNGSACILQAATNWLSNTSLMITAQSTASVEFSYLNGGGKGTALTSGALYKINYFCTGH